MGRLCLGDSATSPTARNAAAPANGGNTDPYAGPIDAPVVVIDMDDFKLEKARAVDFFIECDSLEVAKAVSAYLNAGGYANVKVNIDDDSFNVTAIVAMALFESAEFKCDRAHDESGTAGLSY